MLPQNLTSDVMTPVIRIIYNDVITGKMADKKNCLNTISDNKECQKTQLIIYKDKAAQKAALRVTNSSLPWGLVAKIMLLHLNISYKGHSLKGKVLTHNAVYLQIKSLSYNRSPTYVCFASLCFGHKLYEPRTKKVQNLNSFQMIHTIANVLVLFSGKKEVLEDLQSLKASMKRETETEFYNKWLDHTNGCLTVNVKKLYPRLFTVSFLRKRLKCPRSLPPLNALIRPKSKLKLLRCNGRALPRK